MSLILIVDDSPVEIKLIRKLLGSEYETVEATSGQVAIELANEKKPDLILLDIIMPEMDGLTVCKRLKAAVATADIPVIFITAMADSKNVVKGFEAGGQDYIAKPFYSPELRARIKVHLELKKSKEELAKHSRELEARNERLNELLAKIEATAMTDFLTGLSNRWSMTKQIRAEVARMKRSKGKAVLILADIDNFKQINDTYGHDCGDLVLRDVAGMMNSVLREEDVIARWGGEEFLLMLPDLDLISAPIVAESIRKVIETAVFYYDEKKLSVTITIGVAELDPNLGFDESIKNADEALYRGKNMSKNCITLYRENIDRHQFK